MVKISRPILYTALLGVIAYVAVTLTEPEAPRKKSRRTTTASSAAPAGFTEEDLKARFARYPTGGRDAFRPGIAAARSVATGGASSPFGDTGIWLLTGINQVNGVRNALLENGATGEAIYIRAGERWNGMMVQAIEPDAVLFVNDKGKTTRITFVAPEPEKPAGLAPVLVPPVAGSPTPIGAPSPRATPAPRSVTVGSNLP